MKEFNKQGIIFLGDTHGNFDVVKKICQQVENFAIIHVGDVGLGFNSFKTENEILTKKRIKKPIILTPHIGGNTLETRIKTTEFILDNFLKLEKSFK